MDLPISTVLSAALPVFALLALGFGLRRGGTLTEEADNSIMKLVIRVFYPCLFLDFIIGNEAVKEASNLFAAPIAGFAATAGGMLAGFLMARLLGLRRGSGLRTFAFCNGVFNYGYIPIPLIMALFADRSTLGVLLVFNVGVEVAIWTVGIVLLSGRFRLAALGRLVNPPIIALLVALSINGLGLDGAIPGWLSRLVGMLGACSIPVGILLAGAAIADLLRGSGMLRPFKVPAGAVLLRLGLLPAVFLAAAAWLPGLTLELRQVLLVQAAMPAGIFPIVLARHYGGDASVAVKVVLGTTLASVITMPLWIRFGALLVF
jgi:predicted permease